MCLIRVRPKDEEEEIISTRVVRPVETTTVITPIPPAPAPPPPVRLSNSVVPTTSIYEASYDDSYHTSNKNKYHDQTNSQQYAVSIVDSSPLPIIRQEDIERISHRSNSKHRRHRHRHRSGSREREVTTYELRDNEYDTTSVHSGMNRSRSVDYRRNSAHYGQSPRSSYRYIDPRGSSHRVVSGGTAIVSTTAMNGHRRTVSASENRGRERSREREMLTYGNPRLSTASYRSYGGSGRKSRERIIMVDDEYERVKYS